MPVSRDMRALAAKADVRVDEHQMSAVRMQEIGDASITSPSDQRLVQAIEGRDVGATLAGKVSQIGKALGEDG